MFKKLKRYLSFANLKILLIGWGILLMLPFFSLSADKNFHFQRILQALDNENNNELLEISRSWSEEEPENPEPVYLMAFSYYLKNYPNEAREALNRAASLDSNFEKLLVFTKKLNEAKPDNYYSRVLLGDAYSRVNRSDEAISILEKTVSQNPDHFFVYFVLGHTYMKMDDSKNAKRYFRKTLELKPDFLNGYNYLGLLYAMKENFNKAEKIYLEGIRKNKELGNRTAVIHLRLANVMLRTERYERALDIVQNALEIAPENPGLNLMLGDVYRKKGNLDKAEEIYQKSYEYGASRGEIYKKTLDNRIKSVEQKRQLMEKKKLD